MSLYSVNSTGIVFADLQLLTEVANSGKDRELRDGILEELAELNNKLYALWLRIVCKHEDVTGCYVELVCGAGGLESYDWVASSRECVCLICNNLQLHIVLMTVSQYVH